MSRETKPPAATVADMAAGLDGGLDGERRARLDRALADDGGEYGEMAASARLVDAVAARRVPVPADLLEQALSMPVRPRPARRLAPWLWVGGAVLATIVAAMLLPHRPPPPPAAGGPVMAEPVRDTAPAMLPAANPDVVPPRK